MSVVGGFILTCMLGRVNIYTGSGAILGLHTAMLLATSDAIPSNIFMLNDVRFNRNVVLERFRM